ncbi:MAG: hypothetical protein WCE69_00205 [Aestuariivirga sp.]
MTGLHDLWLGEAAPVYGPRKSSTTLFQTLLHDGEELVVYPVELKLKFILNKARLM